MNRLIWENWNWSAGGEEWTPSPAWKQSVIDCFLEPAVRSGASVVEIGPGGGRWTEALLHRAGRLEGIDISEACVLECRRRFAGHTNASFDVGTGSELSGVQDDSVDTLWPFDVFVHINRPEFQSYAAEFARVLKPGGAASSITARSPAPVVAGAATFPRKRRPSCSPRRDWWWSPKSARGTTQGPDTAPGSTVT